VPYRDPEKAKAWNRENYLKNKDQIKERVKANQRAKREQYNAYMRAYRAKNGRKDRPTKTILRKSAVCIVFCTTERSQSEERPK